LNRAWKGTDQAFSLEPAGMRRVVRDLERAKIALGDGVKRSYPSEAKPLMKMQKKIVAARDLPAGRVLTEADLTYKSPADEGLRPFEVGNFIGQKLTQPLTKDQALTYAAIGKAADVA
jgi:sialic acid synthase